MGIDKIIEIAVALALVASATGQLPKVIRRVQLAEVKLLQESNTSSWGKLMIIK
jgi:hypothetical protein